MGSPTRPPKLVEWSGGATGLDQWLPVCLRQSDELRPGWGSSAYSGWSLPSRAVRLTFPSLPAVYGRACPSRGFPQSESAITTRPNHPLPRQDLHLQVCPSPKAAHVEETAFHAPPFTWRCTAEYKLNMKRILFLAGGHYCRMSGFGRRAAWARGLPKSFGSHSRTSGSRSAPAGNHRARPGGRRAGGSRS